MSFTGFGYKNKFDPRRQNDTSYQGVRKLLKSLNGLASDDLHCIVRIRTKWGFDQSCKFSKTGNVKGGGTLTGVKQQGLKAKSKAWVVGGISSWSLVILMHGDGVLGWLGGWWLVGWFTSWLLVILMHGDGVMGELGGWLVYFLVDGDLDDGVMVLWVVG